MVLQEIDDLVDDFIIGATSTSKDIAFDLRIDEDCLKHHDYCYILANAADIYNAFLSFGWRLFDLNLRYEVQNSTVNSEIVNSLFHHKSRRYFHHYNNGLIIVCQNYSFKKKGDSAVIGLSNAQIINGLQTVKSIYNAISSKEIEDLYSSIEKECKLQIKVIKNNDPEFVQRIVQATNNQNPMSARNLKANNREQKEIRAEFAASNPRWFLQIKEGEWSSLSQDSSKHHFKAIVGHSAAEFKPDPSKKFARVIDNQ